MNLDNFTIFEKKTVKALPSNCPPPYSNKGLELFKKLKAFTLAETLITLTIIGIIAALTIPNLLSKYEDQKIVTGVLKGYSVLKNAYNTAVSNNGPVSSWGRPIGDVFSEQLKVVKTCTAAGQGCMAISRAVSMTGKSDWWDSMGTQSYLLSDGSAFSYLHTSDNCTNRDIVNSQNQGVNCGKIFYDINGPAKPNRLGRDIFMFAINYDGIYAREEVGNSERQATGISGDATVSNPLIHCNLNATSEVWNGVGCTDWILKMKNVDYLHCSGLNYQNPKCKK